MDTTAPSPPSKTSLQGWPFPSDVSETIASYLYPRDVINLTSTCTSFQNASYRVQALIAHLPKCVGQIYAAMRAREDGPVPCIPVGIIGGGCDFYPKTNEMQGSFAITKRYTTGHRGIVVLVGGVGDGSIECPFFDLRADIRTRTIPIQNIFSCIFIKEKYTDHGDRGWYLEPVGLVSYIEDRFREQHNLLARPGIGISLTSILSGNHPTLACVSPDMYAQRPQLI